MRKILLALLFIPSVVFGFSNCSQLYPNPKKPIAVSGSIIELCNSFYVVHYDPIRKTALFSSAMVSINGKNVKRLGAFKTDPRVMLTQQAHNSDYASSGWDRGHLTPAADADTDEEMFDTFYLTNIVPQAPELNRGAWRELEAKTRDDLKRDTIVVTGAIFRQWDLRVPYKEEIIGNNQIPIPYAMFKIVFNDIPVIWYAENKDGAAIKQISFDRLKILTGINFKSGIKIPKK